jgi:hypothetical protein
MRVGRAIEATQWPTWYPNSKEVDIQRGDPVLRDGTVFRWTTFRRAPYQLSDFLSSRI